MPCQKPFNHRRLARDGRYADWCALLDRLPPIEPGWAVHNGAVHVGAPTDDPGAIQTILQGLMPWRKGPWCVAGVDVDAEWRCDLKWARLSHHVDLSDRRVLDVGAGNGYFGWRMLDAGARSVVGCDPMGLFVMQHALIQALAGCDRNALWAERLENLPLTLGLFDTVFSMGVLSHRRYLEAHHMAHLGLVFRKLAPGGCLVLETLVVPNEATSPGHWGDRVLMIDDRYARMRNVYALPSVATLIDWLSQSGFGSVEVVDQTATTEQEQRATEWMPYQSLVDGLSVDDPERTIEGHPRPIRAIVLAMRR